MGGGGQGGVGVYGLTVYPKDLNRGRLGERVLEYVFPGVCFFPLFLEWGGLRPLLLPCITRLRTAEKDARHFSIEVPPRF